MIPPNIGAPTGAIPFIAAISEKVLANELPVYKSVTIDRDITNPPAPANPCINRQIRKECISRAYKQATVETIKSARERISGVRRPYLSLKGPIIICPTASPIIQNVNVS